MFLFNGGLLSMFKRYGLLILTNILVMVTISIGISLLSAFTGIKIGSYGVGMEGLLLFCLIWGFAGAFISLGISKWMAKRAYGVQIIDPNTMDLSQRDIVNMVHGIARRAGLEKMPEVGIYDSDEINAFATGPSKKNSLVALSSGLLRRMNRDEVEGVVGHEIAHIANGDMVTMTLIQGVVNSFVMFLSRIFANIISSFVDEKAQHMVYFISTIVLDILFSILGSFVVAYYSRAREFRADYGGAKFAGRDKMIAGLRKLQAQFDQIEPDDRALATMKISNRSAGGLMALMSTHPSLEDRIERLQKTVIV
jgi:heat shock protein HtpX